MTDKANFIKVVTEHSIFSQLFNLFSEQILRDFQNYVGDRFGLPTSLWKYGENGDLKLISLHI